MNTLTAWSNAQADIRQKIGESAYQSWFSHLTALSEKENTLIIAAPDEFFKNWIVDHYLSIIQDILKKHATPDLAIEMRIIPREEMAATETPAPTAGNNAPAANQPVTKRLRGLNLNPRLTFENFVVGSSNQMACGASQAVANSPAKAYNPLFLYGQSGLGKTHLMQAIANHVVATNPGLQCVYLTSEQFTNELIDSIHHKTTNEFKQKYRNVDILLIDDIQFIAGKRSTQEEFFHTFNAMHDNRKQIVISS
ncbi:MAG: DnaA/Hda family protein, partial [Syntrophales bacterium]|nr:DnaA/Hda family protein [Syntrophales bacterium]